MPCLILLLIALIRQKKLDLSFTALHPLMSSLKLYSMTIGKEKAVGRTKPISMRWQQLNTLNVSAKLCRRMLRAQVSKLLQLKELLQCHLSCSEQLGISLDHVANRMHGTWDWASVAKVWTNGVSPHASCQLRLFPGKVTARTWQLAFMSEQRQCLLLHKPALFWHYKKRMEISVKYNFHFTGKQCFPSFFLLSPFFFSISSLKFLQLTALLLLILTFVLFFQDLNPLFYLWSLA